MSDKRPDLRPAAILASKVKADLVDAIDQARVRRLPADHPPIHRCNEAMQPNIHLVCLNVWTTPKWGSTTDKATGIDGVHKAETGDLYTFRSGLVTCTACKEKP